jgi:Flp pilus assembly protein TadG
MQQFLTVHDKIIQNVDHCRFLRHIMSTKRLSVSRFSVRQLMFSGQSSLACDTRGGIAIAFAAMAVPLFLTVGGAIDYSRAVHFRAELQSVADSAALAAANDYDGTQIGATTATAVGNAYLSAPRSPRPSSAPAIRLRSPPPRR